MAVIDSLARGQWPAATTGNDPFVIDVTKGSRSVPLIVLDYPGEVFTRAIVDDMSGEAEQELRDHVDAASAVILLLDPGVAVHGTAQDLVEDEHGMPQVVERVRKWPGGQNVPVAMVLTKYDLHEPLIRAEGGKLAFVRRWYPRLIESVLDGGGTGKVFGVAAVRGIEDARGNVAPGIAKPAYNVLRPLEYCVATMFESDRMEKDKRNRERVARSRAERQEHDRREAARASSKSRLTVLAIVMTVILMALVAAVFVWG
jgi:hypothetical protein